jgi:aminodeoxyfutalosine synthase
MSTNIQQVIAAEQDPALRVIGEKIVNKQRISPEDGLVLFEKGSLPFVGALANFVRERLHGDTTYFNRNFHIEPTNVCVFACSFCSYSRLYAHREEGWELTTDQMLDIVKSYDGKPVDRKSVV